MSLFGVRKRIGNRLPTISIAGNINSAPPEMRFGHLVFSSTGSVFLLERLATLLMGLKNRSLGTGTRTALRKPIRLRVRKKWSPNPFRFFPWLNNPKNIHELDSLILAADVNIAQL
jgi:hypothetical protein